MQISPLASYFDQNKGHDPAVFISDDEESILHTIDGWIENELSVFSLCVLLNSNIQSRGR